MRRGPNGNAEAAECAERADTPGALSFTTASARTTASVGPALSLETALPFGRALLFSAASAPSAHSASAVRTAVQCPRGRWNWAQCPAWLKPRSHARHRATRPAGTAFRTIPYDSDPNADHLRVFVILGRPRGRGAPRFRGYPVRRNFTCRG